MKTEITMRRRDGDRVVKLTLMSAIDIPFEREKIKYRSLKLGLIGGEGHTIHNVDHHLKSWTLPQRVEEVRERVEKALEEGVPDQRRRMLRHQEFGMLDGSVADEIAMGLEVERPFVRWTKSASDTCRVAVCIDANIISWQTKENYEAKVALGAGIAMALESLDYEVMVVTAVASSCDRAGLESGSVPPRKAKNPMIIVRQLKAENESCASSHFAALSDTGIARLMQVWSTDSNSKCSVLLDCEWREMTESDLFIHIKDPEGSINCEGMPADTTLGLKGDDVLSLDVNEFVHIDKAVATIEEFFQEQE